MRGRAVERCERTGSRRHATRRGTERKHDASRSRCTGTKQQVIEMADEETFDVRTSVTKLTGRVVLVGNIVIFYAYSGIEGKRTKMLPAGRLR